MLFHYISHHGKATSFLMCASGFMVFLVYFNYNLMLSISLQLQLQQAGGTHLIPLYSEYSDHKGFQFCTKHKKHNKVNVIKTWTFMSRCQQFALKCGPFYHFSDIVGIKYEPSKCKRVTFISK